MFDPSIVFQRTQAGRDEIRQKSHGLTQSERLVLIMIDGVTDYQGVRRKVSALTDQRFERALTKLQAKELVLEVFMPLEGQAPEELEGEVIDRFLQQDPLDPVTIIVHDPEEELEGMAHLPTVAAAPISIQQDSGSSSHAETALGSPQAPATSPAQPEAAMDATHIALADSLAKEVRRHQARHLQQMEQQIQMAEQRAFQVAPPPTSVSMANIHWGYWLIALGCGFIGSFFVLRWWA